jgi:hypothetical protein
MIKTMFQYAAAIFAFLFVSCSPNLSPFTERLKQEQGWSEEELSLIQFYLSDDVVLRRQISSGSTEIISGEIKIIDGKRIEEIIVPEGTPGILVENPKSNRLGISFEGGHDERFLMFGPNPKRGGRYVLLASDWDKRRGTISYDGRKYYTNPENGALANLLVDLKKTKRTRVTSRTAGGRKID